ncbi:formylmethanofuran dehydrogenase subunit C [Ramlibacter sp.]|uniref:formylmethanofuran dehydrogenase subunit C n=1 Tax=Ramlibacter sp. TaxID=1917967 RepID=UPI0026305B22|nr:formylmethanofuran dehydrogenase subunit C [Ramlibacter sp.]MDB5955949.1 formylmethanofuran dehydrogenase subunit [Ramlibacter sp.]
MRHTLSLRTQPRLRVDARAWSPVRLAAMTREEILRLPLQHGRASLPLAELFAVRSESIDEPAPQLRVEGDLSRFDCLGAGLAAGTMEIDGKVGDCLGLGMSAGELRVSGTARDLAGCAMSGGWLEVRGDVGDFAGGPLPGAMEGMSGGTLLVHGRAGARLGDRMRRGTVVVHGDAGDFLASRLVAGTIALGGRCGAHPGWAMRRGSIVFAGEQAPVPAATFVPVHADLEVIWQLLARDLARFGGRFQGLAGRSVTRWAGDLAVQGRGEWLLPR